MASNAKKKLWKNDLARQVWLYFSPNSKNTETGSFVTGFVRKHRLHDTNMCEKMRAKNRLDSKHQQGLTLIRQGQRAMTSCVRGRKQGKWKMKN